MKYTTQKDAAEKGIITDKMREAAEYEGVGLEVIIEKLANGRAVLPANKNHKSIVGRVVGEGFKTKINVNSGVAIPIIKLEGEQKLIINNNQGNKVYNLAVKNYDENEQITQVELEYYIEIISKKNDDINFKIYKEEKELNINNNKTEKFLLTKENKQRDNYKIEILLNKKISEDILQNVEIKVYSEQKNKKEVKE